MTLSCRSSITSSPTSSRRPFSSTRWAGPTPNSVRDLPRSGRRRRDTPTSSGHRRRCSPARGGERLWSYWQDQLGGTLPVLDLPTDRPRSTVRGDRGHTLQDVLDPSLTSALVALAEAHGASLYSTLLAAFQVFLARHAGQDEIVVGTPASGRTRRGDEGLVGYCVNMLPMRASLAENPRFDDFLARTRRTVAEALEHQEFPFSLMVERFRGGLDPGRPPICAGDVRPPAVAAARRAGPGTVRARGRRDAARPAWPRDRVGRAGSRHGAVRADADDGARRRSPAAGVGVQHRAVRRRDHRADGGGLPRPARRDRRGRFAESSRTSR